MIIITLTNTGAAAEEETQVHPADISAYTNSDVYRLSAAVEGEGWTAQLLNSLAAVEFGMSQPVVVYVSQESGGNPSATVSLRATSESDPSKTAAASVQISSSGRTR